MFIFSTISFSVSSILKTILILLDITFSITFALIDSYCSFIVIKSISSKIFWIVFIE